MVNFPWHDTLYGWAPFRIDALGLVTLLGAEEINQSIGRLVPSRYLEYLPLLGAFVIAGERFKEKRPSFNLYNITDGINTTDFSFWLTRWMIEQDFRMTRSVVHFEVPDEPLTWRKWHIVSALLSFAFTGFLIAMTVLIGDWYGFANAIAMVISILTRAYAMQAHRNAIDRAVLKATTDKNGAPLEKQKHPNKKCIMVLSDSRIVTLYLPGNLIIPVFVYNPEPAQTLVNELVRYLGWGVFGVHIVTIGMATLVPQMYTVALMVIPTVLITWKLGCDDSQWRVKFNRRILHRPERAADYECWIGTRLKAYVSEWPVDVEFEERKDGRGSHWVRQPSDKEMHASERSNRRQDLYAWLNMNAEEESSMAKWDLLPHERGGNESWWRTYKEKKALIAGNPHYNADPPIKTPITSTPISANPFRKSGTVVATKNLPRLDTSAVGSSKITKVDPAANTIDLVPTNDPSFRPRRQSIVTVNGMPASAPVEGLTTLFRPPGRSSTWHTAPAAGIDNTRLTSNGFIATETFLWTDPKDVDAEESE